MNVYMCHERYILDDVVERWPDKRVKVKVHAWIPAVFAPGEGPTGFDKQTANNQDVTQKL